MKNFIDWIKGESTLSEYSKNLFLEAYPCYKAEAFRSAYIVSYLGFLIAIRDRVLESYNRKPVYVDQNRWDTLLENLNNEEAWEKTILTEINRGDDKSLFRLPQDVRNSISHWKNERNNAVHGRKSKIAWSQVHYFLDFVIENMSRFHVGGGVDFIKKRVESNFESITTQKDYSFKNDIEFLWSTLNKTEFLKWQQDIYSRIQQLNDPNAMSIREFWRELATSTTPSISECLLTTLKENSRMFFYVCEQVPVIKFQMLQDKSFLKKLVEELSYFNHHERGFYLLIELHKNEIITTELFTDCLSSLAQNHHNQIHYIVKKDVDLRDYIISNGYIDYLRSYLKLKDMRDFSTAFFNERPFLFIVEYGTLDQYIYDLVNHYLHKMYSSCSMHGYLVKLTEENASIFDKIIEFETLNNIDKVSTYLKTH